MCACSGRSAVTYAGTRAVTFLSAVSVTRTLTARGRHAAVADRSACTIGVVRSDGITGPLTQRRFETAVAYTGAKTRAAGNALLCAAVFAAITRDAAVTFGRAHAVAQLGGQLIASALRGCGGNSAVALAGAKARRQTLAQRVTTDSALDSAGAHTSGNRGLVGDAVLVTPFNWKRAV